MLGRNTMKTWWRTGAHFDELKTLFDMRLIWEQSFEIPVDEVDIPSRSSHQVGESEGTCPLRFSFTSGKDVWSFGSEDFQETNEYTELFGIDGEPIELEWTIFPGFTPLEILEKIRRDLETQQINPEQVGGIIICMSIFNDIDWTKKGIS